MKKIQFTITSMYEVNIGCTDDNDEAVDYVYANAIELIENGEAKFLGETVSDVCCKD